jgi:predicted ATPase/DNA-binding SARP family transcriptional activator
MGKPLLEIQLFGASRLVLNGRALEGLRRKNRALVFYLAAGKGSLTRENLLAFFWPDRERLAAQPILRTMIHDLRKQLGESFQADDQTLALSPDTLIDAKVFSAAIDSPASDLGKLTDALALYKGDFLEGFSLADTPQFDDWAASERERYRLLAARGHADLARHHEALRDFPAALESMRRALAFNPFQEDLQREVMRLLYLNGDRAGVIRQYESLRKLLDEEMGVPPMPETRSLYDAIINDAFVPSPAEAPAQISPAPPKSAAALLPFAGRETELGTLKAQLGSGKLILLEGEPGIGKTRLVSELIASQAREKGSALVLKGVAYELEQGLPYQPILDALRGMMSRPDWKTLSAKLDITPVWLTELGRLLPGLLALYPHIPAPAGPADEARLWEALLQFFHALSRRGKVWLFLDDLHWADAATLGWLGYLIRHTSSPGLVLLATSRPEEGQTDLVKLLQTLRREDRLFHLQLSTLVESAMQTMAAALSPGHEDQLSAWLVENAEGNPFFLTELVRYAYSIGLLKTGGALDAELFGSSPAIPATIQNLIESRLLRLSEQARDVLHLAAIIGREFDFELLQQASSLPESDILDATEELQTAHLIRPLQGEKFAFDHSLTMQVVLQDMSLARRHVLHRRVAEALEAIYRDELDPVSGSIARHFMDGNLPARAAAHALRAGKFAANLAAWVEAVAFYQQALEFEADPAKRAGIFLEMGTARLHKGDFAQASDDYRTAVDLAAARRDWSLLEAAHLALNQSFLPQARFAEAIALAKELRESGPPELALCAEFCWGTGLGVESAHPVEAEFHLREAGRLLAERKDYIGSITPTQIIYQLAGVVGQQGRSMEAIDLYRQALAMLERGEAKLDILRNIMLYNNLAYHLHLVGDPSAAGYIRLGIKLAREKGSLSHLPYLYSTSGEIALAQGDLDVAEKYFGEGLALAEQIPVPERIAGMTANLGLVAKQRGDNGLACKRLKTALNLAQQLGNHHLEVRIQIWLTPLLPSEEAHLCLDAARTIAEQNGLHSLLEEIVGLEKDLTHP